MINRDNYEEFFLLYVDDELDAAQRIAVENFVEQNPDVADELQMLKHTKLIADDDIQFEAKDVLYKKPSGITLSNYEEYFLLAVDDELNNDEAQELEKFVLQHPQLQQEFTLLQSTILPKELVAFDDKATLYKTGKKERRTPIAFMRIGVAASMLGVAASVWMLSQQRIEPVMKTNVAVHQQKISSHSLQKVDAKADSAVTQQSSQPLYIQHRHKDVMVKITTQKTKKTEDDMHTNNTSIITKNTSPSSVNKNEPMVAAPLNNVRPNENNNSANANNNTNINATENVVANTTTLTEDKMAPNNTIVRQAVYNELANEDDNNSVYIGGAEINKTKLKGLLRKAVNFFDRKTTNNEPDKTLQIASFQIKSK